MLGDQAGSRRRRILLVDDVELNRILTAAVLVGAAYDVDSVGDGAAAIEALDDMPYDLVLLDLDMPGIDGHSAAATIRRRENDLPLAALSSRSGAADRLQSNAVGMDAHITRPIAAPDLLRAIDGLLSKRPGSTRLDPWRHEIYDDLVHRLGEEKMEGVLSTLLTHCESLRAALDSDAPLDDEIERQAHDLASVSGMLGFEELSQRCIEVLKAGFKGCDVRTITGGALRRAIHLLRSSIANRASDGVAA